MTGLDVAVQAAAARANGPVVLACSGGVDSVVLARMAVPLLRRRGVPILLAHLDHGMRPRGGADDAAFVSALAAHLKVALIRRRQAPSPAEVRAVGPQAAARSVRHGFLAALARRLGGRIWLAHQQDDQLETVWMQRMERRFAPGMAAVTAQLVRPLLGHSRAEIEARAHQSGWSWRDDPSNGDPRYMRTQARAVVRLLTPPQRRALLDESGRAAQAADALVARAAVATERLVTRLDHEAKLDVAAVCALPDEIALRVLRSSVPTGFGRPPSRAAWATLLRALRRPADGETRDLPLGAGVRARWVHDTLTLGWGPPLASEVPRVRSCTVGTAEAFARLAADPRDAGRSFAVFDASDPAVRGASPGVASAGRRMRPFGGASRLVRDLLSEAGAPPDLRARWPVVENDAGEILWIPGVRASALAPLRPASPAALVLYTVAPCRLRHGRPERSRT